MIQTMVKDQKKPGEQEAQRHDERHVSPLEEYTKQGLIRDDGPREERDEFYRKAREGRL